MLLFLSFPFKAWKCANDLVDGRVVYVGFFSSFFQMGLSSSFYFIHFLSLIAFCGVGWHWMDLLMQRSIQQVEQTSEADSVKGKPVALDGLVNFLAILKDANISIDTSMSSIPDKLRDQLYAGVFLEPKKLVSSISISSYLI